MVDDESGLHVWKCDFGYTKDCTVKLPCKDRCMNGSADFCDQLENENDDCICPDHFTGEFCQTKSDCHPGKGYSDFHKC